MTRFTLACVLLVVAGSASAQPDAGGNDTGPDAERPVAVWHFDGADEPGTPKPATLDAGPRPPAFPMFGATNTARTFDGKSGMVVREKDLPGGAALRYGAGDAVTLEAWVKVKDLKAGSYAYLLNKGVAKKAGTPLSQNYALRLFGGSNKDARVTFLFASAPSAGKPGDQHRWTAGTGFALDGGWHHVAVRYTFGKPESVRGFTDGKPVDGAWDLGGATDKAPTAAAADLSVGTIPGGSAANNFHGSLDGVTLWHAALPDAVLAARYPAEVSVAAAPPAPPPVTKADVPKGQVLVQICDGGTFEKDAWPATPPPVTESYREDAFGFFEVPHKYVDTGVRGDRGNPFLLRAAAVVDLPAGTHRILLRGRGANRLTVDGKRVLTTPFAAGDTSGHHPVRAPESYLNLGPDFRFAPPGNREAWVTFESKGGDHFVVLETVVGSYVDKQKRRPELGETVAAVSLQGGQTWRLLTPNERVIPYTDDGWAAYEAERQTHLDALNAAARAAAREKAKPYWDKRREAAREWLSKTPEVPVPPVPPGFPANNAIDHFVADKIARVTAQAADAKAGTVDYFAQVQPLLEAKCYDCHAGGKVKGGLRLDDRAAAVAGGTNDGPAVAPGKPDASAILARVRSADPDEVMPPKGDRLTKEQAALLETWLREGARWPEVNAKHTTLTPPADDLAFLRRVTLDTVGVVPSPAEVAAFTADASPDKRAKVIDKLLADPRWADAQMGYWLDVLAENPNILTPTLNNTGPFRWWLYEAFRDNKPLDLFATELLRMKGSERFGGPAGFAVASQNDSPFAAKGMIVAGAFLGVEMKCARCHDAPAHVSLQKDLFGVAAMLATKPLTVPKTSSVPLDKIHAGGRKPLIAVTLKPGAVVPPAWPFAAFAPESLGKELAEDPADPRDRLAALVTAPQNERFAQVAANRIWKRLMGRGIVDPVDDWERGKPTHPELLKWLGRELVRSGYDQKHVARLVLNSHAYVRATDTSLKETTALYAAPAPRRMAAEQVVDSLFAAAGKAFRTEELSLDVDNMRTVTSSITLGKPRRSWMLASTSNERDRPSLALPRIQAVTDVLQAFGWRGTRQEPTSARDQSPNVLQPAILSNGTVGVWLTRLSDDHAVTQMALKDQPLDAFVDALFVRLLTRPPTADEREAYTEHLKAGYETRIRPAAPPPPAPHKPVPYVSWSNHLAPEATTLRQAEEAAARRGDPPTDRLDPAWRGRAEDVLWALLNSPEFVFAP